MRKNVVNIELLFHFGNLRSQILSEKNCQSSSRGHVQVLPQWRQCFKSQNTTGIYHTSRLSTCKTNCLFFQSFTGLVHEYNVLDLVRINVEQTYIVKYHESRCLSHFFLVCKTSCFKVNSAKVAWEAVNLWHFADTYWDQSYILESVVSIRK